MFSSASTVTTASEGVPVRALTSVSADTFTPGIIAFATISSFADVDQRRRGVAGLASSRETVASMTWKLLCPDRAQTANHPPALASCGIPNRSQRRYMGPNDRLRVIRVGWRRGQAHS